MACVAVHPVDGPYIAGLAPAAGVERRAVEYEGASFLIDARDYTVEFTQVAVGVC